MEKYLLIGGGGLTSYIYGLGKYMPLFKSMVS